MKTDFGGLPIAFHLTGGEASDSRNFETLLDIGPDNPAEAGGGCLRNLGAHGLDMFIYLTGEEAQVTGAQLSRRAHELRSRTMLR